MNSLTKTFIILVMISLVGFTIVSKDENSEISIITEVTDANSAPTLTMASVLTYTDKGTMTASWYGPRFHGRTTANGETYDQFAFTAAHKQLRFGTLLRVTNPRNNKSVIVRINDRGPYIRGRELDLSQASATSIGLIDRGVLKVKVEQISLKGVNFPVISLN